MSNDGVVLKKVTARIDKNLCNFVNQNFHYGQQKKLFDNIFLSLKTLIQEDRFDEVVDYIERNEPLILPAIGDSE